MQSDDVVGFQISDFRFMSAVQNRDRQGQRPEM